MWKRYSFYRYKTLEKLLMRYESTFFSWTMDVPQCDFGRWTRSYGTVVHHHQPVMMAKLLQLGTARPLQILL
jgi:hypothetical protein